MMHLFHALADRRSDIPRPRKRLPVDGPRPRRSLGPSSGWLQRCRVMPTPEHAFRPRFRYQLGCEKANADMME